MRHGDAIASLRSWEARFPVARWTVDGLHVWPLIRARLASRLLAVGRPVTASPVGLAASVSGSAADLLHRRVSRVRAVPRATAVMLTRPANRQFIDGAWYDRLFDPITDVFETAGLSALHLEHRPVGVSHRTPRFRPAFITRPAVTRRNVVAALRTVRGARLDGFEAFAQAVDKAHPTIRGVSPLWVARQAQSVELVARFFGGILEDSQARLAFCSVYYTVVGMAFCLAARRHGVPSVDVQHGVTAGNPAYDGWSQFPEGGYELLPDYFWAWSREDAAPVNSWPEPARRHHRTLVGGHPWLALWGTAHPTVARSRTRLPPRSTDGVTVLVTLTWSSGFSDLLKTLLREAPVDWTWWIRLHPLMERERAAIRSWCAAHARGRAWVDGPTDLPLPLLLEAADVHVTHNSSVVQEAARTGRPSVVIDPHALDVYAELGSGWAVFADTPAAIVDAVRRQQGAAGSLRPLAPYPSWAEMAAAVHGLLDRSNPCLATAAAASFPTPGRA